MKAVIQRVQSASVHSGAALIGSIGSGLLVLIGIAKGDTERDLEWLCQKISKLRIMADDTGKMNYSVVDVKGEILLVSQFTLLADASKGSRPSYMAAAAPQTAILLYRKAIERLEALLQRNIASGSFGADMQVSLINDGPVTVILDTKEFSRG